MIPDVFFKQDLGNPLGDHHYMHRIGGMHHFQTHSRAPKISQESAPPAVMDMVLVPSEKTTNAQYEHWPLSNCKSGGKFHKETANCIMICWFIILYQFISFKNIPYTVLYMIIYIHIYIYMYVFIYILYHIIYIYILNCCLLLFVVFRHSVNPQPMGDGLARLSCEGCPRKAWCHRKVIEQLTTGYHGYHVRFGL